MPKKAQVLSFGGGVVLEGGADTQHTDELRSADGYHLGSRGALVTARDRQDYVAVHDLDGDPWSKVHALRGVSGNNFIKEIAVGEGKDGGTLKYLLAQLLRAGAISPIAGGTDIQIFGAPFELGAAGVLPVPRNEGVLVTVASFPGVYTIRHPAVAASQVNVTLVNIGAREGFAANLAPGLYAIIATPPSTDLVAYSIGAFDALGAGERGEYRVASGSNGTHSRQLRFRGIAAYNGYAMGWGFDKADLINAEGPARLMFSNPVNPLKWGFANTGSAGTDVAYTDSDAVSIGDGSETIRAGLQWNGRFYAGTDRGLHYLAGYGRDSFVTDGANPIARAENVLGPNSLLEGPDKLLYGIGDNGLWRFDGGSFERHHTRLRRFKGDSPGYWDLIWNDRLRADAYPGKTNADLVWLQADWENEEVVIGIPWCDATAGGGYGTDTVILKFNVRTGGFTRQVFEGVQLTAADYGRRQRQYVGSRFFGTATAGEDSIQKYGSDDATTGTLPDPLPSAELGPYALFGPNQTGSYRKTQMTVSWDENGIATGAWVTRASAADDGWNAVCWSEDLTLFAAVSETGTIMTSPDGEVWHAIAAPVAEPMRTVCWSPDLQLFVAVGTQHSLTSPDGVVWTAHAIGSLNIWLSVCWAPALSLFVAVGDGDSAGGGDRVMTSPDGIVWTIQAATDAIRWSSVCWSEDLGLFVAVAFAVGSAHQVMTSTDGVTWAAQTAAGDVEWTSVCWSPRLQLFCAVADAESVAGTGDTIMISPDGITWTGQPRPVDLQWTSVCWAEEIQKFVAVSKSGAGNRVMSSANGTSWATEVSAADNNWQAVCWGAGANKFVAVSNSGAGNRVMTSDATVTTPDLAFNITAKVDDETIDTVKLSIRNDAPAGPAVGDVWLDTSGTDTSLGNARAGTFIGASADYLVKVYNNGAWRNQGIGGQKGPRATIPVAFRPRKGTRLSLAIDTVTANRPYQIEGVSFDKSENAA